MSMTLDSRFGFWNLYSLSLNAGFYPFFIILFVNESLNPHEMGLLLKCQCNFAEVVEYLDCVLGVERANWCGRVYASCLAEGSSRGPGGCFIKDVKKSEDESPKPDLK